MNSVITTSKTVIPNIKQQTHKLAVLRKIKQCALQPWGREKITESDMAQFMQEAWCTIHMMMVFML